MRFQGSPQIKGGLFWYKEDPPLKPETLNPKPLTLNPKPLTPGPRSLAEPTSRLHLAASTSARTAGAPRVFIVGTAYRPTAKLEADTGQDRGSRV